MPVKYYPLVNVPIPAGVPIRPGSFEILPDGRLAVGTRRGDIYFIKGAFDSPPTPEYHLFASGQDEIFSLSWKDGAMTATTWGEVTRISDVDGDGIADRYDTLTSNWGYAEGHEFAFGSKHDPCMRRAPEERLSEPLASFVTFRRSRFLSRCAEP